MLKLIKQMLKEVFMSDRISILKEVIDKMGKITPKYANRRSKKILRRLKKETI